MGLYRDENGLVFETDDAWARSHGYTPVTPAEQSDIGAAQGYADRADRGPIGDLNAAATGLASGLTLGGTDALLGLGLDDTAREQLLADLNAHPYERGVGELVGGTLPAFLSEGTLGRTPTGYLSRLTGAAVDDALEQGGVRGTAKALAAMGTEGALMNTGAYLGHTALEDKEVTAEGLQGAVGSGFEFGVAGGGAMLGITNGTIAARKLFSRVMNRSTEKVAESSWSMAAQQALDADAATADAAKQRLDEIRSMKEEALKARQDAKAATDQERIRAEAAGPQKPFVPEPSPPMTTEGGTQVIPRAPSLDELRGVPETAGPTGETQVAQTSSAPVTKVVPGMRAGVGESVTPDFTAPESGIKPPSEMEALGRGEAEAKRLASAPTAPTPERTGILGMLDELAAHESSAKPLSSLAGMRSATTAELLGKQVAAEEEKLMEALQEFQAAKSRFVDQIVIPDPGKIQPKVPTEFASLPRSSPADPGDVLRMQQGAGTAVGKGKKAFEILDQAHENALERLQHATTPEERGIAMRQADALERLLEKVAPPSVQKDMVPGDFLAEIGDKAKVVDRYEKASSKLVDAVGDAAHPAAVEHAKAYADAGDEAVRKATDRTTRAAEDADTFGPFQYAGPEYKTPRERVTYAKERQFEANQAFNKVSADERQASKAYSEAKNKVAEGEKAKRAALRADVKATRIAEGPTRGHRLGVVGGVYEMLDIPGLPKVHDLPVVGPLLSAWLKYRAARVLIRGGRLPATADARVAALSARTQDRIARSIDRSLGFAEKIGRAATKAAPLASGVVLQRIYDDGGPVPPKDASLPEHVAARVRELSAYVNTPGAIENDVRKQLIDVSDPDLIAAAEKQRRATMEYLLSVAPQAPAYGALQKVNWKPSPAVSMSFARRLQAASDPESVFAMMETGREQLSLEAAETMRQVYPQLFMQAQQRILQRAAELKESIPTAQRIRMSLVYQLPLDSGMDPDNLKITQSVFVRPAPAPAPAGATPPMPSIAQPTNLLPMYQLPSDRTR